MKLTHAGRQWNALRDRKLYNRISDIGLAKCTEYGYSSYGTAIIAGKVAIFPADKIAAVGDLIEDCPRTNGRYDISKWAESNGFTVSLVENNGAICITVGLNVIVNTRKPIKVDPWTMVFSGVDAYCVIPLENFWPTILTSQQSSKGYHSEWLVTWERSRFSVRNRYSVCARANVMPIVHGTYSNREDAYRDCREWNANIGRYYNSGLYVADIYDPEEKKSVERSCLLCDEVVTLEHPMRICDRCKAMIEKNSYATESDYGTNGQMGMVSDTAYNPVQGRILTGGMIR